MGPFRVEFVTDVPGFAARWDELFTGFPAAEQGLTPIHVSLLTTGSDTLRSAVDDETIAIDRDPRAHELALTRVLNHRKLDAETDLVHFHAAAVARSSKCAVLAGRSGDGKSTLTARLVSSGWEYVTDEQVTLAADDWAVVPYPRPLTLRLGVWHLFPGIGDSAGGDDYRRVETSLRELGGVAATGHLEPAVILAPRYSRDAIDGLVPFGDAADVVQFLASCCHDLERTGTRGCAALVRLASTLPAHHLRFSDVDTATALVERAFIDAAGFRPISVARIDTPSDEPVVAGLLQRAPGATAWFFGDGSGIAFHPEALRLARLDTLACALWEALDVPDTLAAILADAVDDTMRSALEVWIARLTGAGLLVGA